MSIDQSRDNGKAGRLRGKNLRGEKMELIFILLVIGFLIGGFKIEMNFFQKSIQAFKDLRQAYKDLEKTKKDLEDFLK